MVTAGTSSGLEWVRESGPVSVQACQLGLSHPVPLRITRSRPPTSRYLEEPSDQCYPEFVLWLFFKEVSRDSTSFPTGRRRRKRVTAPCPFFAREHSTPGGISLYCSRCASLSPSSSFSALVSIALVMVIGTLFGFPNRMVA